MELPASLSLDVINSLFRSSPVRAPTYLKRPAVAGLVTLGEDPLTVCRAWLGKHSFYTDAINQGVADIARAHHAELAEADLRDLIERALQIGEVKTRKAFYELGADLFGPGYLTRASADNAKPTRDWAARRLAGPGAAELPARSKAERKRKSSEPETLAPGDAHA